jgi:hydrogenase maturation protein HypF
MAGGDKAAQEPWGMALSYLYYLYGEKMRELALPVIAKAVREKMLEPVITMIRQQINTPLTSSAGRLFDAVAALTGICMDSSFHAEAPMRLESYVDRGEKGIYPWEWNGTLDMKPVIRSVVEDYQKDVSLAKIAARFHNTLTEMIVTVTEQIAGESGLTRVVLSGGTFQNRVLLERAEAQLEKKGLI